MHHHLMIKLLGCMDCDKKDHYKLHQQCAEEHYAVAQTDFECCNHHIKTNAMGVDHTGLQVKYNGKCDCVHQSTMHCIDHKNLL